MVNFRRIIIISAIAMLLTCVGRSVFASSDAVKDATTTLYNLELSLNHIYRDRTRFNIQTNRFEENLLHSSTQLGFDFSTTIPAYRISFDLGGFLTYESITGNGKFNITQYDEFVFAGDKWNQEYKNASKDGFTLHTARVKFHFFDDRLQIKAGLQPINIPGLIDVNWSFAAGSYRGLGLHFTGENYTLSYAIADQYKAPWYRDLQGFSKRNYWDQDAFDVDNQIDYIHALSLEITPIKDLRLTMSLGESAGYTQSAFFKVDYLQDGFSTFGQIHLSENNQIYSETAYFAAIGLKLTPNLWTIRTEATYAHAPGEGAPDHQQMYIPRLTRGYANSQGHWGLWWDSRSDFNHHNEIAIFAAVSRSLDDIIGHNGLSFGLSGAYGWGATKDNIAETGKESAWNIDLSYRPPSGWLKGFKFALHYTHYDNHQSHLGDWAFSNMFNDERDLKIFISRSFDLS